MKLIKLKTTVLLIMCLSAGRLLADEALPIKNCTWCHGTSGQGYTVAPRLAGQRYQYLESQLLSFKTHARDNPFSVQYMWDAVAFLNPQTARDLAFYFSTIPPKAANDGDFGLAPAGRAIYEAGIPDLNIVSCAACHGPNAEGVGAIPRLGGLSYLYLKRKLEQWGQGYHVTAQFPMPQVAIKLPPDTIDALASYLSFVK
jgi:cytochrome c553